MSYLMKRRIPFEAVGLVLALWLPLSSGCNRRPSQAPTPSLESIQRQFDSGNYADVLRLTEQYLASTPQSVDALMLAAESATKLERFDAALELYARVPDSAGHSAAVARWASGEIEFHLGHVSNAIEALEASLQLEEDQYLVHDRLVFLFNAVGRRRESQPHLMALMRMNRITVEQLLFLGNLAKEFESPGQLKRFMQASPADKLPNLGLARIAIRKAQLTEAEQLLQELLEQRPDLVEAHVQLASLLAKQSPEKLFAWNAALPPAAESNPDIWYYRGIWMRKEQDPSGAIYCFAQSVLLDPNHLTAHTALAQLLESVGEPQLAEPIAERSRQLQELNIALEQVFVSRSYVQAMREAAELSLKLGRVWEAVGWSANAQQIDSQLTWPQSVLSQVQALGQFTVSLPQTLPQYNLVADAEWLARYPRPDFNRTTSLPSNDPDGQKKLAERALANVKLTDVTRSSGLDFMFYNPEEVGVEGRRMLEFTGGGIGVIDYDCDGWPEVFLAQGTDWPVPATDNHSDVLVRNLGSQQSGSRDDVGQLAFAQVTEQARISENAFGQGVAIGDINADGFDDLYVCNIGANQLWINAGDGTFVDGSPLMPAENAPQGEPNWTVSAVIVDINSDGLAEIYDTNYVSGPDVFTRRCPIAGKPRVCTPLVFSPAQQRVLFATDQGNLRELPQSTFPLPRANGLGAVAFRATGAQRPSIFVAVDQQANLWLESQPSDNPVNCMLQDMALVNGLAFSSAGTAQACMGIATGDLNEDGELDLYVTNFYEEYNTLYLQKQGLFNDSSYASDLVAPSMDVLGFGTQTLDLQLDGLLDLVVLNGHIDDQSHIGVPEKMRPQVMVNVGGGRFQQCPAESAGDFFTKPGLGRCLARLDFNRDGRDDLICGDLGAPLVLLQNDSQAAAESLRVILVGTQSERGGACAVCTLWSDGYHQVLQAVAGGGYMATNERGLLFSLAATKETLTLNIDWPSGHVDNWSDLDRGAYIAVENQGIYPIPDR